MTEEELIAAYKNSESKKYQIVWSQSNFFRSADDDIVIYASIGPWSASGSYSPVEMRKEVQRIHKETGGTEEFNFQEWIKPVKDDIRKRLLNQIQEFLDKYNTGEEVVEREHAYADVFGEVTYKANNPND